ncbi:transcriptional regulator GntR family [Nitrospirillum viridazoti Y2]|uniref:DNA-binding FadR family transcriptional regulator n=1 Tax=Nitrospirillum amazonense TaxID=28077 RepID=A0A560HN69_9PROT|nr:GntR family transcriptional regulator [Nitrospirillum amazonense]EGY02487.1 transcriptional regulator GntR family [Nitrospirillum amazonense Y2]TWB46959.1 DNA-binding FadR family transcriptional regulator [Nitrospirillum amazonense]
MPAPSPRAQASLPVIVLSPQAEEQDSLLADVIGERRTTGEKGACRIARLIEEKLITGGWPHGMSCGSEQALIEGFGIGRAVIREAVRILEVRGTARMVRGPGGGLRVLKIDPRRTADFLVGFGLFSGVTDTCLREAEDALRRVRQSLDVWPHRPSGRAGRQPAAVLDFFDDVVGALRQTMMEANGDTLRPSVLLAPEVLRRSRAGQIAGRMLRECTVEQWVRGHRLGSEEDLCFHYSVERDIFRQAVRILESVGAAVAFCGRGHGLVSQAPRAGAVARLVSCLFASSEVQPQAVMLVFQRLSVEIVALAAAKASPQDCDLIARSLDGLEEALELDAGSTLPRVFEVEEAIVAAAANPVLQLFIQSLRGYPSARIPRNINLLGAMNRAFLQLSRPILDAFRINDVETAVQAQEARTSDLSSLSHMVPELHEQKNTTYCHIMKMSVDYHISIK